MCCNGKLSKKLFTEQPHQLSGPVPVSSKALLQQCAMHTEGIANAAKNIAGE